MSQVAIKVENLAKLYQLGEISTGTLSRDLTRWWAGVRGREDPYQKVGQVNDRSKSGTSDFVWALQDISFEVKKGEILGIIGRNGAGKSTLLKILSRVTKPTTGRIRVRGRMASLLEVGTGFHPELTGRENIFLNGAILGMRRDETRRKLDEIVDFAGVERYLDTPVKRYSSGMYVRLAFAVAAHLEPEILIVDEVLAVGDAEFQKKCLGKMKDVSENDGRTVLFVSHNMEAVQNLCNRGMLLAEGKMMAVGDLRKVVNQYLSNGPIAEARFRFEPPAQKEDLPGFVTELVVEDSDGNPVSEVLLWDRWRVRIRFQLNEYTAHFVIGLGVCTQLGLAVQTSWSTPENVEAGVYEAVFSNDDVVYSPGNYYFDIGLSTQLRAFQYLQQKASIHISDVVDPRNVQQIVNTKSGIVLNQKNVRIIRVEAIDASESR